MAYWDLKGEFINFGNKQRGQIQVPNDWPGTGYVPVFYKNGKFNKWVEDLDKVPTRTVMTRVFESLPVTLQLAFSSHLILVLQHLDKEPSNYSKALEVLETIKPEDVPEAFRPKLKELKDVIKREIPA